MMIVEKSLPKCMRGVCPSDTTICAIDLGDPASHTPPVDVVFTRQKQAVFDRPPRIGGVNLTVVGALF